MTWAVQAESAARPAIASCGLTMMIVFVIVCKKKEDEEKDVHTYVIKPMASAHRDCPVRS